MPKIEVIVGNKSYNMMVDEGQESRVKSVAARFDVMVQEIKKSAPNLDRDNVLVLAGVMLSDEFLAHQQEQETREKTLNSFHNTLAERLEKLAER